jgi:hypothetical protein
VSNIQYQVPYSLPQAGTPVIGGGGGSLPVAFRDILDAKRCEPGYFAPWAEYPDGYLGVTNSKRQDRLMGALKDKLNSRAYQRGVHKGEVIDQRDYFWPNEFGLMSGIERQATTGLRAAPIGTIAEQLTMYGQQLSAAASLAETPPNLMAGEQLRRLAPSWK